MCTNENMVVTDELRQMYTFYLTCVNMAVIILYIRAALKVHYTKLRCKKYINFCLTHLYNFLKVFKL